MRVWKKEIGPEELPGVIHGGIKERIVLYEIDCSRRMYRVGDSIVEYKDSSIGGSYFDSPGHFTIWVNIMPETVDESLYERLCIKSKQKLPKSSIEGQDKKKGKFS